MKTVRAGFPLAQDLHRNSREIEVGVQGVALNYATTHALVDILAKKVARDAMLVAWFDGKNDVGYPVVQECTDDKPGWLAYAESHGSEFVFVFATGLENQGG